MTSISAAVMYRAGRERAWLAALLRDLTDFDAVVVVEDRSEEGDIHEAHRRAWRMGVAFQCDYHVVLCDDIAVARDFGRGLVAMQRAIGDKFISAYQDRSIAASRAHETGVHWLLSTWVQGLAMCVPTTWIGEMLLFAERWLPPNYPNGDEVYRWWALLERDGLWVPNPVPVQHLGFDHSLMQSRRRKRWSDWFMGRDASVLSVDWTVGAKAPIRDYVRPPVQYFDVVAAL